MNITCTNQPVAAGGKATVCATFGPGDPDTITIVISWLLEDGTTVEDEFTIERDSSSSTACAEPVRSVPDKATSGLAHDQAGIADDLAIAVT